MKTSPSKEYTNLGDYYIQEKIDGSQLTFAILDGELKFTYRGKDIDLNTRCFQKSTHMISWFKNLWNDKYIYHGESVTYNKHNIITYDIMPKYNYVIYDIYDTVKDRYLWHDEIKNECSPLLGIGDGQYIQRVKDLINSGNFTSYLGGKDEGAIIKFRKRTNRII